MKHLKFLSLTLFTISQATVIHISPDESHCSIEAGINDLSRGIMSISEVQDLDLQLGGIKSLLSGITNTVAVRMNRSDVSRAEKCEICDEVNKVNDLIIDVIEKAHKRSGQINRNAETEKKTILEGLKQIISGIIAMTMGSGGSIKPFLTMVFAGVMKILSAIFADGRVDAQDWENIKGAIASLISGKRSELPEDESVFF